MPCESRESVRKQRIALNKNSQQYIETLDIKRIRQVKHWKEEKHKHKQINVLVHAPPRVLFCESFLPFSLLPSVVLLLLSLLLPSVVLLLLSLLLPSVVLLLLSLLLPSVVLLLLSLLLPSVVLLLLSLLLPSVVTCRTLANLNFLGPYFIVKCLLVIFIELFCDWWTRRQISQCRDSEVVAYCMVALG